MRSVWSVYVFAELCARVCVCVFAPEVMVELDICLIGYVKKCKYKIRAMMLAQACTSEEGTAHSVERSGTRVVGSGKRGHLR